MFFSKSNKSTSAATYIPQNSGERRKKRFYAVIVVVIVIVYLAILAASLLVLRNPALALQKIEVAGNQYISSERAKSAALSRLTQGSFWREIMGIENILIWPERLKGEDLVFLPEAKSVAIKKDYRKRSVLIKVEERRPYGIWCFVSPQVDADRQKAPIKADENVGENPRLDPRESALGCYWFDDEGVIHRRAVFAEGSLIATVSDYSQTNPGLRAKILPEALTQNAFSVFEVLRKSRLRIKEIRLNDLELEELEVLTFDGPRILFSLRFSANNLLDVIENLSAKAGFRDLEYIDFRVENRAYYK